MFTRREFLAGTGAVLASTALTHQAAAATSLDLATVWPDGNFHTTNAKRFAEEVGKVTGGDVKINVQAGGSLGFKGPEQLRAVRDGLVPLADILTSSRSATSRCLAPSRSRFWSAPIRN